MHRLPLRLTIAVLLLAWSAAGCARLRTEGGFGGYETRPEATQRTETLLKKKHQRALEFLQRSRDLERAEQLLREALAIDATYGPAHNSLGTIYLKQGKHYFAAWEFEYARRLMPERTEPINNLGLVFESAGQLDRAIEYYEMAYLEAPHVPQYLGNLIRARVRRGDRTSDMIPLLEELVMLETRPDWRKWAQSQIATGRYPDPIQPLIQFEQPATSLQDLEEIPEPLGPHRDSPRLIDPSESEDLLPAPENPSATAPDLSP